MKPKIITADEWALRFARALEIDTAPIRRLVVDAEAGQPLKVYVEYFGDERLLNVETPPREAVRILLTDAGRQGVSDVSVVGDAWRAYLPSEG